MLKKNPTIRKSLLGSNNNDLFPKAYIIHENSDWIKPLIEFLEKFSVPYEEWFLDENTIELDIEPPIGVFYNRMSASSHTRGHRFAPELTGSVLSWLELYHRRIINNRRALQLEIRKSEQYASLKKFGLNIPKTFITVGKKQLLTAASLFGDKPFIVKPNRGGKGLNVVKFNSKKQLEQFLNTSELFSLDGILLVQDYIKPKNGRVVRMEFVGGKFLYAVSIDSSDGFELCPADHCEIEHNTKKANNNNVPTINKKFHIIDNFSNPIIEKCNKFLFENGIEIAGIEYSEDEEGNCFIYDVNTNTNYNSDAENLSGKKIFGMKEIAFFLKKELEALGS